MNRFSDAPNEGTDNAENAGADINRLYELIEKQATAHRRDDGEDASAPIERNAPARCAAIILKVAAPHLPASYVAARQREMNVRALGDPRSLDNLILRGPDPEVNRFIGLINESVNTGRHVAQTLRLNSTLALRNRRAADASFHRAYVLNVAYRHGVDSVVFEGERKRALTERTPCPQTHQH